MGEQGTLFGICGHPRTAIIPEKRGPHYAKQVCSDCGKFLRWMPSPETIKRQAENAGILAKLAMLKTLSEWERHFVRSLASHKNISPKQQVLLDKLRDTYLTKGDPADDGKHGETMSPNRHPPDNL